MSRPKSNVITRVNVPAAPPRQGQRLRQPLAQFAPAGATLCRELRRTALVQV